MTRSPHLIAPSVFETRLRDVECREVPSPAAEGLSRDLLEE